MSTDGQGLPARAGSDSTKYFPRDDATLGFTPGAGPDEPPRAAVGEHRFSILRSHARGGLGEVFLALDQQLNREVALKEIQSHQAHDPESRQRFLLESEITGRLEHPGIVPVYARGSYEDGRLYYAMRFIRGESLKESLDKFHQADQDPRRDPGERALSLRKLLARFNDACNAVGYAHSRGVVHRDIKPSNIMLGPYGETLVVDWGLAKIMQPPTEPPPEADRPLAAIRPGSSSSTQMGAAVGTPVYMSPEQALGWQQNVGPASDIYSLGATLYELLTGRHPFGDTTVADLQELLQNVMAGRILPPRKVNPRVSAALEAICLKAMANHSRDRYATAQQLADDIEAWLADEPVKAWPEPWTRRLARWRRRHRPLVAGLAAAAGVAVASLLLGMWLLFSANQRVARERDRAERNFAQLRQASNEMMDVIEQWLTRLPEAEGVQQALLRKGLNFYEDFLRQAPTSADVREEMAASHQRVAAIRRLLGQHDMAAQHSRLALAESRRLAEEFRHEPKYRQRWAECSNWLGEALRLSGKSDDARRAYQEAIRIGSELKQEFPEQSAHVSDLARAHYNLGLLLHQTGDVQEAEKAFEEAIDLLLAMVTPPTDDVRHGQHLARCRINLGILLKDTNRPVEADAEYRRAIELLEDLTRKAPNDPELRYELATAHMDRGNLLLVRRAEPRLADGDALAEAQRAYRAAIGMLAPLSAEYAGVPRFRKELANCYNGLGSVLLTTNFLDEARDAWSEARQRFEALLAARSAAEYHSLLGLTLGNLSLVERRLERPEAARELLLEAVHNQAEAVRLDPQRVAYRRFLANHRVSLARLQLAAGEHALAALQAEELPALSNEWQESHRAAQLLARCLTAANEDASLEEAARAAAAEDYARRGIVYVQEAIQRGLRDAALLESDEDLRPLRGREDFRALVAQIKAPPSP